MSQNKHAHPLKAAANFFVFLGSFFFLFVLSSDLGRWDGCKMQGGRWLLRCCSCSAADIEGWRGCDWPVMDVFDNLFFFFFPFSPHYHHPRIHHQQQPPNPTNGPASFLSLLLSSLDFFPYQLSRRPSCGRLVYSLSFFALTHVVTRYTSTHRQ